MDINYCNNNGDTASSIAFYKDNKILYRLYLSPDTIQINRMTHLTKEVDSLAATMGELAAVRSDRTELDRNSQRLYQLLLGDLDTVLPPTLHIVANGTLETLPFNVLRKDSLAGPKDARYLGVEHALSRQFSLRTMELLNELTPQPKYRHPLAFAPIFEEGGIEDTPDTDGAQTYLSPLRASADEMNKLRELSGGAYHSGAGADLETYYSAAGDFGILHLATHAISNPHDGLESRFYLWGEDGQPTSVTAGDISRQDLNAELVTLSACETSRGGQNTVEGTIGLTRAFLAAGARTVVASNWAVDDRATAEMMATFYDHVALGEAPHQALRAAREAYLEDHPNAHPSRWAAFEAFGGTKPINWDRSKAWHQSITAVWTGLALVFATFLTGLFYYRNGHAHA